MPVNINYLGEGFLGAVFLFCGVAATFSLVSLKSQADTAGKILRLARGSVLVAAGFSVVTLGLLTAAFLTDDFSIAVVSRHSSIALPVFYKISAVWAGSAGSLLLWTVFLLVLFSLWLIKALRDDTRFTAHSLAIGAGICLAFAAILLFLEKPFAPSPVTVDDGSGLNPLLQNFWMIAHPPLLFIGYSAFLIPFAAVTAGILTGKIRAAAFYQSLRRWLIAGVFFLGLGIVTGARWSYIELGWGGYWAWDPVENASLLPWLAALAALHSLVAQRFADRFVRWTAVLLPVPFILSLVATFITRSGILASVHSFDPSAMSSALLVFIGCCLFLWVACTARVLKTIPSCPSKPSAARLDKKEILFWANIIFIVTAAIIGLATFWPVFSRAFSTSGVAALSGLFYDRVITVVGILSAFLVGLVVLADFQRRISFTPLVAACLAAGSMVFAFVFRQLAGSLLLCLACGLSTFSFVAVIVKLWGNLNAHAKVGGQIAHLGLLLVVVAAGFAANEETAEIMMTKGQKVMLGKNHEFAYDSFTHKSSVRVVQVGPEIVIRKKRMEERLWPHNNLYPDGQSTSEVDFHTGLFEDIYVSFNGITEDGRMAVAVKIKPLMLWLWVGAFLIVAGSAVALVEEKRGAEQKAIPESAV